MPIPKPTSEETEQEFVSRCVSEIIDEYDQQQALAVCYSTYQNMKSEVTEEAQQGGVVSTGSFGKTKLSYSPKAKEKLSDYMGRCMSDPSVKEYKKDRVNRAAFCYSEYQNSYIMSLARSWK